MAVVALRVSGNTVTTTLRLVQGTAPESIEISYYQNGKLLTGTTSQSLKWSGQSAAVETELSGLGTTGSLTVIIGVPGDTNVSNNNRTATLGASPDQPQPPASVTGLRGSATQNTITLTWTASADADSYRVLDKNGNVTATVTGTSYTATGLSPDTSYTYYVVAVRDGASSGRASITCKTLAEVKPTEPEPTEPEVTEPKVTEPVTTETKPTEPTPTEPKVTEPKSTEPKATEPKPTEPATTEPKVTEPKPTEPAPTEPGVTEPKPTEPDTVIPGDTYVSGKAYHRGDTVVFNGKTYRAKWWTRGENPETSQVWELVDDGNQIAAPAAWSPFKIYTAGMQVTYKVTC